MTLTYVIQQNLLSQAAELYGIDAIHLRPLPPSKNGKNITFSSDPARLMMRFSCKSPDYDECLAELEFIDYLAHNGASVAKVIRSSKGNLAEKLYFQGQLFVVAAFAKAKGLLISSNCYKYRNGVPVEEFFYNCGKLLGEVHKLSKNYRPSHLRHSFSDRFNKPTVQKLLSDMPELKDKMCDLLDQINLFPKTPDLYGLVHFDFNDDNYNVDYGNGDIVLFDFDECCYCWYSYDLASLWVNGRYWVEAMASVEERKRFMEHYFSCVLQGYRSQTYLPLSTLQQLPLMIKAYIMKEIFDLKANDAICYNEKYKIKCLLNDIDYYGFFEENYYTQTP